MENFLRLYFDSEGQGNISYGSPPGGAGISLTTIGTSGVATLIAGTLNIPDYSATVTGADEGLTLAGSNVQLGYLTGGPVSGLLTGQRTVGLNGHLLSFYDGVVSLFSSNPGIGPLFFPADVSADLGHQLIMVQWFNVLDDAVPWRLTSFETDNGDGTFDHIMIQGFNHAHSDDAALPGWFESIEYHFLSDFYERHIQFQAYASELRLQSFTYTFSGVDFAHDTCLLFHSFTLYEMRSLLGVPIAAYSFTLTGVDYGVNTVTGITGYIEAQDDVAGSITMRSTGTNVAGTNYAFQGWLNVYFSAIGPHAIFATPADFSFTADKIWVSNPASNALSFDNASSLDLQINFQPSRNAYHMIVSTATADWGDYIPTPNGYTRSFYAIGTATPMLQLAQHPTAVATFGLAVQTPAPFGGVTPASFFAIGSMQAAATALDTTQYLEMYVGGALRKILVGL